MGTGESNKIKQQSRANEIVEMINQAIRVMDFELGDGKNVPQLVPIGNQKFKIKIQDEIWTISFEKNNSK